MNDPTRFRESGSDAPAELRALFDTAASTQPSEAELARVAAKLGSLLAPSPTVSAARVSAGTGVKLAVAGAVALGVAGVVVWRERSAPVPSAHSATATSVTTALSATTAPSAMPPPPAPFTPSPSNSAPAATASAVTPSPSSGASNASANAVTLRPAEIEADLLERARAALTLNPARALGLCEQHRARFPHGLLAQEREVIAIDALKRLHRTDAAARRAADFARRYPGSAYQRKLDANQP